MSWISDIINKCASDVNMSVERAEKEILERLKKKIDDFWEGEEIFDLHIRACKIEDVGGKTQDACRKYKEWVKEKLKKKLLGGEDENLAM